MSDDRTSIILLADGGLDDVKACVGAVRAHTAEGSYELVVVAPDPDGITAGWHDVVALPTARLHLYGKEEARPGRKMGHVNFTGATLEEVRTAARDCARMLHIALD